MTINPKDYETVIKTYYAIHTDEKESPDKEEFMEFFKKQYFSEFSHASTIITKQEVLEKAVKKFLKPGMKFFK